MNQCAKCGKEIPYEPPGTLRAPCPNCKEMTLRSYQREITESAGIVSDEVHWKQSRKGTNSVATITDANEVTLSAQGRSPKNEEGADECCARLVSKLNDEGGNWTDPVMVTDKIDDVDAVSNDRLDSTKLLKMQVVRATANRDLWQQLSVHGTATLQLKPDRAADELMAVVEKKASKYPEAQKRALILVIDSDRTPTHTFSQVVDSFKRLHSKACVSAKFSQVWLVGTTKDLAIRLDA